MLDHWCLAQKDNVYSYSVSIILKKDFVLIHKVNEVIASLVEFGLVDKWIKMSDGPDFDALVANAKKNDSAKFIAYADEEDAKENVVLTMDHIIGALVILVFGHILALIAFLVEQIVHAKVRKISQSKFFLNLDKFLRPNPTGCSSTRVLRK